MQNTFRAIRLELQRKLHNIEDVKKFQASLKRALFVSQECAHKNDALKKISTKFYKVKDRQVSDLHFIVSVRDAVAEKGRCSSSSSALLDDSKGAKRRRTESEQHSINLKVKHDPFAREHRETALIACELAVSVDRETEYGDSKPNDFVVMLNKFPVVDGHFLLITEDDVHRQTDPVQENELWAMWICAFATSSLGFYNCGEASGASQVSMHKYEFKCFSLIIMCISYPPFYHVRNIAISNSFHCLKLLVDAYQWILSFVKRLKQSVRFVYIIYMLL